MKEDKKKLMELSRNLNSKHSYASLAQALLNSILPRFKSEEFLEEYKLNQNDLKDILRVTEFYSSKHLERAERNLKKSFYMEYVLS